MDSLCFLFSSAANIPVDMQHNERIRSKLIFLSCYLLIEHKKGHIYVVRGNDICWLGLSQYKRDGVKIEAFCIYSMKFLSHV
jgi:hypothetical protein